MSNYDDILQEDASSVEMKKRTKEMKIRVAKVIFKTSLNFSVLFRFLYETIHAFFACIIEYGLIHLIFRRRSYSAVNEKFAFCNLYL